MCTAGGQIGWAIYFVAKTLKRRTKQLHCAAERVSRNVNCLTNPAVVIEVFADVLFEAADDFMKNGLCLVKLILQQFDTLLQSARPGLRIGYLTLLVEVPKESHTTLRKMENAIQRAV